MQNEIDKAMEAKIRAVRGRYLKTLQGHTDKLKELLLLCQQNKLTPEDRTELLSNAHHLAGNGAIFGFNDVSEIGMSLQDSPSA
jgi:HPt (histidine-containing phosphotransfer) domain-containing protein